MQQDFELLVLKLIEISSSLIQQQSRIQIVVMQSYNNQQFIITHFPSRSIFLRKWFGLLLVCQVFTLFWDFFSTATNQALFKTLSFHYAPVSQLQFCGGRARGILVVLHNYSQQIVGILATLAPTFSQMATGQADRNCLVIYNYSQFLPTK